MTQPPSDVLSRGCAVDAALFSGLVATTATAVAGISGIAVVAASAATAVAATGDQDQGKNDEPDPVVVKKIAQTVVHITFLRFTL